MRRNYSRGKKRCLETELLSKARSLCPGFLWCTSHSKESCIHTSGSLCSSCSSHRCTRMRLCLDFETGLGCLLCRCSGPGRLSETPSRTLCKRQRCDTAGSHSGRCYTFCSSHHPGSNLPCTRCIPALWSTFQARNPRSLRTKHTDWLRQSTPPCIRGSQHGHNPDSAHLSACSLYTLCQ